MEMTWTQFVRFFEWARVHSKRKAPYVSSFKEHVTIDGDFSKEDFERWLDIQAKEERL